MSQVINWICLICVTMLVLDIMVYFWKDTIKVFNTTEVKKRKSVVKTKIQTASYNYEEKIAK